MDGFYESKKSPQKGRPKIHGGGKRKKNVGEDHEEAKHISNGYQACQSSVKSQIGGNCIEIASSAMEKVRMLLQLQSEEEDVRANESVGICEENKVGNGRLVNHKERLPVENSLQGHLGEMQKPADEGRIAVNGDGQARRSSVVEASQRHEDEERMADGLRPFRLNLPSNAVFTQGTMHKMADLTLDIGYAPGLTSTARLSHTQPCQELLGPHTSTKDLVQLAGSSVDEDEDVDVLEVSSLNSELPAVSTVISGVDLSTEEEEEDDVEEDVEIDVLGLEPD
ncbi:uncharacterized protein LOC128611423 [Ictalurus furcatus]|uniref:uncharacterized protein LOC128611423 n=1 Tax=Ictalurus furcatus TaxID=66913 RepID=UPI0023500E5C|nr:uncharacterized protein LOC128611423 [Ictalurus furcatus]